MSGTEQKALCKSCLSIDLHRLDSKGANQVLHSESYQDLEHSASTCPLCKLFLDSLNEVRRDWANNRDMTPRWFEDVTIPLFYFPEDYENAGPAQVEISAKGKQGPQIEQQQLFELEIHCQGLTRAFALVAKEGSIPRTDGVVLGRFIEQAENLARARTWLEECIQHHPCGSNKWASSGIPPTRLLDINHDRVRLVSGKDWKGKYATLSHCWGNTPIIRTTKASLEQFQSGIPWGQLSTTFQDAISITRRLGISHLWIDSLCIIQDSEEDWAKEVTTMAEVYGHSFLNIAAASAKDGNGGCIFAREDPIALPYLDKSGSQVDHVYVGRLPAGFDQSVLLGPLQRRGWVVQERLLSPRTIYFAEDQLYWECIDVHSEWGAPDIRLSDSSLAISRVRSRLHGRGDMIQPGLHDFASEKLVDWYHLIEIYTACGLTRPSDKLEAVSGLANAFARSEGYNERDYYAGIWADGLASNLLWHVADPRKSKRQTEYRGPSWSWASVDGGVVFANRKARGQYRMMLERLIVTIQHEGPDKFGKVKYGDLIVTGRVAKVDAYWFRSLEWCTGPLPNEKSDRGENLQLKHYEVPLPENLAYLRQSSNQLCDMYKNYYIGRAFLDEPVPPEGPIYILQVDYSLFTQFWEPTNETSRHEYVLVLQETGEPNQYKRIGQGFVMNDTEVGNSVWFEGVSPTRICIV